MCMVRVDTIINLSLIYKFMPAMVFLAGFFVRFFQADLQPYLMQGQKIFCPYGIWMFSVELVQKAFFL